MQQVHQHASAAGATTTCARQQGRQAAGSHQATPGPSASSMGLKPPRLEVAVCASSAGSKAGDDNLMSNAAFN